WVVTNDVPDDEDVFSGVRPPELTGSAAGLRLIRRVLVIQQDLIDLVGSQSVLGDVLHIRAGFVVPDDDRIHRPLPAPYLELIYKSRRAPSESLFVHDLRVEDAFADYAELAAGEFAEEAAFVAFVAGRAADLLHLQEHGVRVAIDGDALH